MYINKALVYGNLTRDPEVKSLPSGITVASFSVATNRVWKDKSGAKQESADYHNVVVFGKVAELVGQYLKKGSTVFVEGRMQTRSWDAQDGQKKYRTEIVADAVQFGPRGTSSGATSEKSTPAASKAAAPVESGAPLEYPEEEINPEDIPF